MQAAAITYIQAASNGVETAAEVIPSGHTMTGHGMRVNAAMQSRPEDTLFTTILQKGIAVTAQLDPMVALSPGDIPLIAHDDAKNKSEDELSDVCTLLMQLMAMNSNGRTNGGSAEDADEKSQNDILGGIGGIPDDSVGATQKGLENAAAVIMDNEGKAAEVLSILAEAGNKAGQGQAATAVAPFETALAGITDALKNEQKQNDTAGEAPEAGGIANLFGEAAAEAIAGDATAEPATNVLAAKDDKAPAAGRQEKAPEINSALSASEAAEIKGVAPYDDNKADIDKADINKGESSFERLLSRDKNRNDGTVSAESGANQMISAPGAKDVTAAERASAVERALNSFADDLRSLRSGSREIRIVLEPESLGVLTISVIRTQSGISARIKSEDKDVAAIISEQVQKLISSMESKGITVQDVDVSYSQAEQNTGFAQHGFSQARDESKGQSLPPGNNPGEDAPNTELWQTHYDGEADSDVTVDYRV